MIFSLGEARLQFEGSETDVKGEARTSPIRLDADYLMNSCDSLSLMRGNGSEDRNLCVRVNEHDTFNKLPMIPGIHEVAFIPILSLFQPLGDGRLVPFNSQWDVNLGGDDVVPVMFQTVFDFMGVCSLNNSFNLAWQTCIPIESVKVSATLRDSLILDNPDYAGDRLSGDGRDYRRAAPSRLAIQSCYWLEFDHYVLLY